MNSFMSVGAMLCPKSWIRSRVVTSSSARLPLIKICRREGGARLPLRRDQPRMGQGGIRGGDEAATAAATAAERARARVWSGSEVRPVTTE